MTATALNEKDTARYVGMSVSFLRRARCEGAPGGRTPGPPFVKLGRSVRYLVSDLDAWLQAHRQGQTQSRLP
jgi:predicted DNA-binding transcriptional regulator AlpA